MTDTSATLLADAPVVERDLEHIVGSAVAMIDEALSTLLQRELVSADEVTDVLLDLRSTLLSASR